MKILVTGGAGYIGSHTVHELKEKGFEVIVYDNLSTGHEWAVKECELVIGDLADTQRLTSVFESHKIDAVVHFAASSLVGESVSNPEKYYENNVVGSKRLFDVMLSKGVNNLVFSSTCATYGLPEIVPITEKEKQYPINSYGWTKFMIERIMQDYGQAYGFNSIALRYFNAAGSSYEVGLGEAHNPESHVIPLLLETITGKREMFSLFGQDYDTADGSCIRDYVHVKDLASAHIMAVERLLGITDSAQTSEDEGAEQNGHNLAEQQAIEELTAQLAVRPPGFSGDDEKDQAVEVLAGQAPRLSPEQFAEQIKARSVGGSLEAQKLEVVLQAETESETEKLEAGQQGFDCFNLGTGEEISVLQLIAAVEKVTGKNVPVKSCERRAGDPPVLVADNSKAVNVLGWKPMHSDIENIVSSAYKWEIMKSFCVDGGENLGNRIL